MTSFDHLPLDDKRGTLGMGLYITTEAVLFVCLFFAYFYTGRLHHTWPPEPPELFWALIMLGVLSSSSLVLHLGERALDKGLFRTARALVGATILLGLSFVGLQVKEYVDHSSHLLPTTNAYGSLFYTITSIHGLHVVIGILMLGYVVVLPTIGDSTRPPHRALHNASLYWHFVDIVWLVIVGLLYLLPRWSR